MSPPYNQGRAQLARMMMISFRAGTCFTTCIAGMDDIVRKLKSQSPPMRIIDSG